jgi:hypothetical protein
LDLAHRVFQPGNDPEISSFIDPIDWPDMHNHVQMSQIEINARCGKIITVV